LPALFKALNNKHNVISFYKKQSRSAENFGAVLLFNDSTLMGDKPYTATGFFTP
jgi:hypothetical protein